MRVFPLPSFFKDILAKQKFEVCDNGRYLFHRRGYTIDAYELKKFTKRYSIDTRKDPGRFGRRYNPFKIDTETGLLYTGNYLGEIKSWNITSGQPVRTYSPNNHHSALPVTAIKISINGNLIVALRHSLINIWKTHSRRIFYTQDFASYITLVVISQSGRYIAIATQNGHLYLLENHRGSIRKLWSKHLTYY